MSRKNPYMRNTKAAQSAKTASAAAPADAAHDAPSRAARMQSLIDSAGLDMRTPSMQQAERYRTDPKNYSSPERAAATHAMDFNGTSVNALSFTENTGFPGFPTLALLAQLPEYRAMHERLADECIRCWGKVNSSGHAEPDKLSAIMDELKRIDMPAIVRQAVIHDQAFGRAHVYAKLKGDEPYGDTPLVLRPNTVRKGAFEGLRVVEAYWVTPNNYNSIDPTAADFYKPSSWWMIGKHVHATRLQTIVSRPVADMLKPTYSFAGVSMTQLAMPYVDNWLRTRQSVSDTVKQFSVSGVKTDLQQSLLPGASQDLAMRAQLINLYRDNRNVLFLDMATEEFFQINTPLSGLAELQAQAQEQMSAVSHIPLIVLLGITPTGLNASSEGELRVFYDYVRGYQQNVLTSLMRNTIKLAQLSLFGEIDPSIGWEWAPLLELTAAEQAEVQAKNADTDTKYIEANVIRADQVAKRLDADPHSLYTGLLENDSIENVPDDDIAGITQKILEMDPNGPAAGGEAVNQSPAGGAPEDTTGAQPTTEPITQPGVTGTNNATMQGVENGIAGTGEEANPATTDPTESADPGTLQAQPAESDSDYASKLRMVDRSEV